MPPSPVRDSVHGYIPLSHEQWDIVDTPLLQRLRRIRQLAFTYLIYPGATHTRFEHTLGVAFIASQISDAVDLNHDDHRYFGLAAILHDIGHGPFSHLSEQALVEVAESCSAPLPPNDIHETITLHLIRNDTRIAHYLAPHHLNIIGDILTGQSNNQFLCQAMSGPIDADKQDYLLRDAYYCGVKYGTYDIERPHTTLRRHPDNPKSPETHMAIRRGGVEATEQFVQARYYMHSQVYSHNVRLCTDYMFVRAILLAILHDNLKPIIQAYTYDDQHSFVPHYASWDDLRLLQYAESSATPRSKFAILMKRLHERRLFKLVFSKPVNTMTEKVRAALTSPIEVGQRRHIEYEIGRDLGIDPDYVIFATPSIGWGFKRSSTTDEGNLLVIDDDGQPAAFHGESLIFRSVTGSLHKTYASVYAPIEDMIEKDQRSDAYRTLNDRIGGIFETALGSHLHAEEGNLCR